MSLLSSTELNTELVECFGELEKLCNQIFHSHHGVTAYIDEMESVALSGHTTHPNWQYTFKKLKSVRHKRNQLSHGEVSFHEPYAEVEDICFVNDFRTQILDCTDPLSMLRKQKSARLEPKPTMAQKVASKASTTKNETGSNIVTAILSFSLTIVIALLIYCIYIYLRRYF